MGSLIKSDLIKSAIIGGAVTFAIHGMFQAKEAIQQSQGALQKAKAALTHGGLQAIGAFAFLGGILSSAKLSQSLALGTVSAISIRSGVDDIRNQKYLQGFCKTVLGVSGIALSAFMAYQSLSSTTNAKIVGRTRMDHPSFLEGLPPNLQNRIKEVEKEGDLLTDEISAVLENGGQIQRVYSTSGVYRILDANGNVHAIFKPDNERNGGGANPSLQFRSTDPTPSDIEFRELRAIEQGSPTKRQHLAKILDHPTIAPLPPGAIIKMQSNAFVDVEAEQIGIQLRPLTKVGYLQKWVPSAKPLILSDPKVAEFVKNHPGMGIPAEHFRNFSEKYVLDQIPLEEFQKVSIHNMLLYNQDGHATNSLYVLDRNQKPHLVPVDMDGILPWALTDLVSISSHPRAEIPLTDSAREYIRSFDPKAIGLLVEKMHLSEQAPINARALATTIQTFSNQGKSLSWLHEYVTAPYEGSSQLWDKMWRTKNRAIAALPKEDSDRYRYIEFIRKQLWSKKPIPENGEEHLQNYQQYHQKHLRQTVQDNFFAIF